MRNPCMVLLLLGLLVITLLILYPFINKKKENFKCCGNIDWYLGNKLYNETCKKKLKENFENQEEYCEETPNFKRTTIQQDDEDLEEYCQSKGLKASYSPNICSEGEGLDMTYDFDRNCKCVDRKNNCKICYPKPKWWSIT